MAEENNKQEKALIQKLGIPENATVNMLIGKKVCVNTIIYRLQTQIVEVKTYLKPVLSGGVNNISAVIVLSGGGRILIAYTEDGKISSLYANNVDDMTPQSIKDITFD